jgi:hypothetical protein
MRNTRNADSCLFGEELVAYLYEELDPSDGDVFERHLLDCSGCTAEFADVSFSRLGVFEWHRDDFAHLATPTFRVPFVAKLAPAATAGAPWLSGLRGLVSSPLRIAFAGTTLGLVVVALGVAVLLSSTTGDGVTARVSESREAHASGEKQFDTATSGSTENATRENTGNINVKRYTAPSAPEKKSRIVKAKSVVPRSKAVNSPSTAQNVPRLGNFVESEDTSLRLADLVADIGTKE